LFRQVIYKLKQQIMIMRKAILTAVVALTIGVYSNRALAQTPTAPAAAPATTAPAPTGTVLAALSADPDYNATALLIRAAGLGETLKGAGPYTIFAPSNIALSNIPSDKLDALIKDPATLAAVLKVHIVTGLYDKDALKKGLAAGAITDTALDGQKLTIALNANKRVEITDAAGDKAQISKFDISGTNGVAIGVDAVLSK